jgi:hypothetical protein
LIPLKKEEFPFAQYAGSKTPLLQIASRNQRAAHSTTIEWLTDSIEELSTNYTQIVRTPFYGGGGDREMWGALERHLEDVERILWFGIPSSRTQDGMISTCGGAEFFLKREPLHADRFVLRPLRDLVLLRDRGLGDEFRSLEERSHEFLSEFLLEVTAAPAIRRPRGLR